MPLWKRWRIALRSWIDLYQFARGAVGLRTVGPMDPEKGKLLGTAVRLSRRDDAGIRPVFRVANHGWGRSRWPISRNGFLKGCLVYAREAAWNGLLVGLGYRAGTTTQVFFMGKVPTPAGKIEIPPAFGIMVAEHRKTERDAEAVVVAPACELLLGAARGILAPDWTRYYLLTRRGVRQVEIGEGLVRLRASGPSDRVTRKGAHSG